MASAVERDLDKGALHPLMREALVVELLRALLPAMLTQSGAALAEACNRCLGHFAGFQPPAPQVEVIDLDDGVVTMRQG
ncbi:hypothetical protein MKK67_11695 [Methylobacterium sp. J-072]|uniref:hypothetical protein n=1 Tax=Methylobacterium sp. J-072 TaxID=2836651 RepID=UPI001FB9D39C|nr:hypothetical protein [Methylobacterium sp. J-072]MCJ2093155.1 hypothetical protein [Methylobacterium sp. J-072]